MVGNVYLLVWEWTTRPLHFMQPRLLRLHRTLHTPFFAVVKHILKKNFRWFMTVYRNCRAITNASPEAKAKMISGVMIFLQLPFTSLWYDTRPYIYKKNNEVGTCAVHAEHAGFHSALINSNNRLLYESTEKSKAEQKRELNIEIRTEWMSQNVRQTTRNCTFRDIEGVWMDNVIHYLK